ncbi:bacteriorhodopsin [Frondihabitans cladoniiphilus]|uniref:bacteriorhodopsin n=1 Tax=Frondihabitans cladoniiphilus TaxID=715785 RepID=UPI0031EA0D04
MIGAIAAPWTAPLSDAQYQVTGYVLGVATLAFLAGTIRSVMTKGEVGSRYRPVVSARVSILVVAFLSYLGLAIAFVLSYHRVGDHWLPGSSSTALTTLRYLEWSVTVPLLCLELLGVCGLVGDAARRAGRVAIGCAFLMIASGFVGGITSQSAASGGGTGVGGRAATLDGGMLVSGGLVGCLFWAGLVVVLVRAVRASRDTLTAASWRLLVRANAILLISFVVYPIVYALPLFGASGAWSTLMQVAYTVADVTVKLVFGNVVLRVAKMRTAEDVRAGDDVHAESIWISSEKVSDAGVALEVHLAEGSAVHQRRSEQPTGSAVAAPSPSISAGAEAEADRGN